MLQVLTSLSMTIVGPLMAWQGWGVWAIVGERISGVIVASFVVWVFIRPVSLQWRFDWGMVKWYLNYGKFIFATMSLNKVLNQFDDFWVGTALGSQSLGFYSKAYEFANYPTRIVSDPLMRVFFPSFAKSQGDRQRLSRAFFRSAALIVRASFLFTGALALSAYELVELLVGAKWLPMVPIFQLMLVYVSLHPLLTTLGNLANATGHPKFSTRASFFQAVLFIPLVVLGASYWDAGGVAVAVDVMLLVGVASMLFQVEQLVDISLARLLIPPILALFLGAVCGTLITVSISVNTIVTAILKIAGYSIGYIAALIALEYKDYIIIMEAFLPILRQVGLLEMEK